MSVNNQASAWRALPRLALAAALIVRDAALVCGLSAVFRLELRHQPAELARKRIEIGAPAFLASSDTGAQPATL